MQLYSHYIFPGAINAVLKQIPQIQLSFSNKTLKPQNQKGKSKMLAKFEVLRSNIHNSRWLIAEKPRMVPQAVPPPPPSSSISFPTFVSALGIAILIFLINEAKFSELGIVLIIPVAILFLYMVASTLISLIHRAVSVISSWLPFGIIQNGNDEALERRQETHVPSSQNHEQSSTLIEKMLVTVLLQRLRGEENNMDNEKRKDFIKQAVELILPSPIVYRSHERTSRSSNGCAICMEDFEDGDSCRILTSCKHMFHPICIENWLRNHLTCPLCRVSIVDSFLLNV